MLGPAIEEAIRLSAGKAQHEKGMSIGAFLASLIVAGVAIVAALLLFILLKDRYSRIL
jgi:hypothetical protein